MASDRLSPIHLRSNPTDFVRCTELIAIISDRIGVCQAVTFSFGLVVTFAD